MATGVVTTAEAAIAAGVTPSTIASWARYGAIAAVKVDGHWLIEYASLRRRIALGRRTVAAQLAVFADPSAAAMKAAELIALGAVIPASRRSLYFAVSTDATTTYFIDARESSCTCKGHYYTGHCYHLVAAVMLETRTDAEQLARIALAA
jgi:hypothetical protein